MVQMLQLLSQMPEEERVRLLQAAKAVPDPPAAPAMQDIGAGMQRASDHSQSATSDTEATERSTKQPTEKELFGDSDDSISDSETDEDNDDDDNRDWKHGRRSSAAAAATQD